MNTQLRMMVLVISLVATERLRANEPAVATSIVSLDGRWSLAVDPQNAGRQERWFEKQSLEGAKPTRVPWIIQAAFPGYHGVAWYTRDFVAPARPQPDARCLLRFWQVDYLAEVYLNGKHVGGHEGGETPFVLDVTMAVKPGAKNHLAVRVLNPTTEPIDGIRLYETARRCKTLPFRAGAIFNHGGITESVELVWTPEVRVDDLFVVATPAGSKGTVHFRAAVHNAGSAAKQGTLDFTLASARSGETTAALHLARQFAPGSTIIEADLTIDNPHLWDLNDPYLYRATARATVDGTGTFDERSVRSGFRDFRFADGYFRLNGRRIYLRSSHTCNHYPLGIQFPEDPDLLRRDMLNMKVMGFNMIRFIWGGASRVQLDLCDEIGLLVYEESYAAMPIGASPQMPSRFDAAVSELVRRDRNHPSIVMWGLLNETREGPTFRHAVAMLPSVRSLDPSRMVMLNSGRWDEGRDPSESDRPAVNSLANPGSLAWDGVVRDVHSYPRVPHTASIVETLRTTEGRAQPVFLTEYGIGSAVDLWRATRHFEQHGAEGLEDAEFFRQKLDQFQADWRRWHLEEAFARPEDFFMESLRKMAGQRTLGLNAIRANPNIISHSLTGAIDHVMTGEGLTTLFRELKPGTIDALYDAWAPLRWCLFAEPAHVARGASVHLEAVLANEDALKPGDYPARFQVVGPNLTRVFDRTVTVTIPKPTGKKEPPLAKLCLAADVTIDGPSGKYQFLATFERGAAAAGGPAEFYVTDPAEMPRVESEVTLWGDDPKLAKWLADHRIRPRASSPLPPARGGGGGVGGEGFPPSGNPRLVETTGSRRQGRLRRPGPPDRRRLGRRVPQSRRVCPRRQPHRLAAARA